VSFGVFEANLPARELRKHGLKIHLSGQPFSILSILLENPGEAVTREEIRKKLWPSDTFVDFDHSLNSAVKKLRDALGDTPESPHYIETIPRVGYRFVAPIETVRAQTDAPEPPSGLSQPPSAQSAPFRFRPRAWTSSIALLAALALALTLAIKARRAPVVPLASIRSIAVLPFENLSGDSSQNYIADGMTDELTTDLAKIGYLRVISRTSAMHFKGATQTLPQIAAQLNVDAVVEGTVALSGQQIRVTAQLIEARDDHHLWAQSYQRDVRDILTLQGQVAQAIADRIEVKLTPEERSVLSGPRPVDPQAYEDYLRGTDARDELSEDSLMRSIQDFNRAIQIDPGYAHGYAGLSHSYYLLAAFGYRPSAEAYPTARTFAQKALQLDDSNAEAYNTLAEVKRGYERDWAGAEADYQRAIALNPSYPNAHSQYALLLSMVGRYDQAVAEAQRNREFDPLAGQTETLIGFVLYRARRYKEAIGYCDKGLAQDPDDPAGHWFLSLTYDQTNQSADAVAETQKAVELSRSDPFYLSKLGYAYGVAGEKANATKILRDLTTISRHRYVASMDFAWVWLGLGNKDSTFRWIDKAYQQHDNLEFLTFPAFDPLRSDPRFQTLMRELRLPQ